MAPVLHEMRTQAPDLRHVVVHTGQHYDRELSEIFFEDLGLPLRTIYSRSVQGRTARRPAAPWSGWREC